MNPSKTTNRLHFEDLDPHRFEDLCYELLDRLYQWKRFDPIGSLGGDDGVDIFGKTVEGISTYCQIKRYQKLSPNEISNIIGKIANVNNIAGDSRIILMVACDLSKKSFDTFYDEAEKNGFSDAQIFTAKKIEKELFNSHKDLLEKYFGHNTSKKKVSNKELIRRNLSKRKEVEKRLLINDWYNIPLRARIDKPWLIFKDTALITLSSKSSLSCDRYNEENSYMKVNAIRLQEGGIECYLPLFRDVVFNATTAHWHLYTKDEILSKEEVRLVCQIKAVLPYYRIVGIEDYDEYFSCPILHCETEDIWDSFTGFSYESYETGVIFTPNEELNQYDIECVRNFSTKKLSTMNKTI